MTAPPVLVLHAAGLDAACGDLLGIEHTITATLPGHGGRRRQRPGMTLCDMADEVAGWVRSPVDVVGLSMGGMVAQHLALDHPDLVRSLVLACTTAQTPTAVLLERADATEAQPTATMVATTLERWFTAEFLSRAEEPEALAYARRCLRSIDASSFADIWRAIAHHDVLDRLCEIDVPTTCLAGTRDVSTPPKELATLAERLPNSRYVEMDGPHMAPLERPDEFRRYVQEHLDWVERSSP
ncbi:alpha/beta fold hydrolase [Mycobacterium neglectum]|uniref:alpha/beta fold hydrolase n=1 Tax=Mycobacterium neglectum TaxID=242737 RepID=UPI000BFF1541|nr:alpha/beta fold hydrolase [Mycobacterium neglectum]